MNPFLTSSRIIVTCKKRLSTYVKQEVEELGFTVERSFSTGVELRGTMNDCIRLNLNLRCASQVLYSLDRFRATNPEDVYDRMIRYQWEKLIPEDGYISVTSNVDNFTVNSDLFMNVKVKDAIADRIRRETSKRPDSGPELEHTVINLYWKEEDAEIFIDTSGHTLAKHGYRKIPGKAPMLEALAAATLIASKWDRKTPFVNPMCGSSTIAIEALLLATNRRPGLYRNNYSFMHVNGYDKEVYDSEFKKIEEQIIEVQGLEVIVSDLSEDAIFISKINAAEAGVEQLMKFSVCDFESTEVPAGPGVIYFNPEYGERLGEFSELEETYSRIGDFLKKKCQGYTGYIFTGNLDLAKKIGLRASKKIEFYTSQIDCRLLEYELYSGSKREERAPQKEYKGK
ncbi:MAG: class I SAM-dependent RNA methyltransferase [Cyclobacteriaceae bacterium]|nr:class I SAM-dependent RNA methyltransferase [Cyclobacteriaceae bacterium]